MKPISIAVVDDHDLVRKGLIALLEEFKEMEVVFEAGDGQDLLNKLKVKPVQVILLDIQMPVMNGIDATIKIREKYPDIKIIMLSMHFTGEMICHLIECGANSFLPKNADIETVVEAMHSVVNTGYYFTEEVSLAMARGTFNKRKIVLPFATCTLTDREIAVIRLLCKEMKIKEAAEKLNISPRTVDSYMEKIYEKTGTKSREGIALYAVAHKLLE